MNVSDLKRRMEARPGREPVYQVELAHALKGPSDSVRTWEDWLTDVFHCRRHVTQTDLRRMAKAVDDIRARKEKRPRLVVKRRRNA
jgi:hypothetical protein